MSLDPGVLIKIEKLGLRYDSFWVLKNFNALFRENSLNVLLGANGSGKSSLLRLLLGLQGYDLGKVETQRPLQYSYAAQAFPFAIDFPMTVFEFIKMSGASDETISNKLAEYNLLSLENRFLSELSGGQLQKAKLLRSLLKNADVYVFDEPLSFLDQASSRKIWQEFLNLKSQGKTLIVTLHEKTWTDGQVDQVLLVEDQA